MGWKKKKEKKEGGPWPGKIYWAAKRGDAVSYKGGNRESHFCFAFSLL